jgi:hypothetical protein
MDLKKIEMLDLITLIAAGMSCQLANNEDYFDTGNIEEVIDLTNPSQRVLSELENFNGTHSENTVKSFLRIIKYLASSD